MTKTPVTVPFAITLAFLNQTRELNGKKPLKAWKESKAKLAAAIDKEHVERCAQQAEDDRATARDEAATAEAVAKRTHGEHPTPKAIKSVKVARTTGVNVAAIAKELGINPKVARAKLRKSKVDRTDAAAVRKALAK